MRRKLLLKKPTYEDIFGTIIWLLIAVLLICSPCEIDSKGYEVVFYDTSGTNFLQIEIGFYLLMQFAKLIGLNYWGFRAAVIVLSLFLINNAIKRLNTNIVKFWCVFSIFPMLYIAITIRFLFAMSLMLLGLSFLITLENKIKARIIFIASIILGTIFHMSTLLFLFLLVPHLFDDRKFKKIMLLSLIVEIIGIFSFARVVSFITSFITHFRSLVTYYTLNLNVIDWFQFMIVYIVLVVIVYYVIKPDYIYENKEAENKFVLKKNIAIANSFLVGLVILNSTFSRYFQAAIIIMTIFIMDKSVTGTKKTFVFRTIFFAIMIFLAYFFLHGRIWDAWSFAFMKLTKFTEFLLH